MMSIPQYFENTAMLHENTMPARPYYIPASVRMDQLVKHREESDRFQLLNGKWKFRFFSDIGDFEALLPEETSLTDVAAGTAWAVSGIYLRKVDRSMCRECGRWQDLTDISIQTSVTHSHLIHPMYHRRIHAVCMSIHLSMRWIRMRPKFFLTLKG